MKPNFSIFSDNLDYALGWMVIHSLWQATLIALISGVLMLFLRKKAAKIRYIVANVALACVLAASAVTFCMYFDFSNDEGKLTFTPALESGVFDVQNQESTLAQTLITQATPTLNPQPTNAISVEGFKDYFNRNLPLILVFWVLGVALFMLRLLGGLSYIYYLKNRMNFPADEYWMDLIQDLSERAGLKKGVELVESAMVRTPMVVGFLKPMILFPMGVINRLSPEEVEAILAHELAHVLRNDYVFNILQSVVEALFYFHPAVWWMSAQISNERESACDDIAINLIKNKMNYARALVAIQEMAYFPMTPALAFAGQRKSQFMMRMQRILNQPNNKTNVMEKLSATCLLLFLMIGLSFGSNLKNDNSNISTEGGPSVFSALDTIPSNSMYSNLPQSGDYNYEDNTQKVKLKVDNGEVKQLIVNGLDVPEKDIPNFSNLTEKILRKATPPPPQTTTNQIFTPEAMENLKQDGGEINLDNLAKIFDLNKMGGADVDLSESGNGDMLIKGKDGSRTVIEHDDNGGQVIISTDKNGNVSKVVVDKNGKTVTENFSREGKLLSKTNITTNEDGGSTITTIESNGNKSNVNTSKNGTTSIESTQNGRVTKTFIDGGVVTTIDDKGKKTVIDKDSEGNQIIKSYDPSGKFIEEIKVVGEKMYLNGKLMTEEEMKSRGYFNGKYLYKNGSFNKMQPQNSRTNNIVNDDKNYINSSQLNRFSTNKKDAYNTVRFKADNGFSYVVFDLNNEKVWKCYQNDKLLADLIVKSGNRVTYEGRTATGEELLRLGLVLYNNALNPKTGGFQIITVEKNGECEDCPQNAKNGISYHYDSNDCDDCEIKDVEDLKDEVSELKEDLENLEEKEQDSKAKMKQALLLSDLKEFRSNIKSKYSDTELKSTIREYQRLKKRYDKFVDDCDCPNNASESNSNSYSYGTGASRADAEKAQQKADKLRRDAQARNSAAQQNLQESRNKAEMNRQKAQAERDRLAAVEDRKQAMIDRQTALEDDKRARKDSKNEDKSEKAKNSIFVNLKDLGYISLNKKCTVIIDKNHIEVDGKTLDNATFKRIYNEFETIYGKKATQLNMYVNGYFTEISKGTVNITGTSTSSLSSDD